MTQNLKQSLKIMFLTLILAFMGLGTASAISFNGKDLTIQEYTILKLELKTKIANRNTTLLQYKDVKSWIEMVNQNLKGCLLKNITKKNLIDKLNFCL